MKLFGRPIIILAILGLTIGLLPAQAASAADWSTLTQAEQKALLGKMIFYDTNLSSGKTMSCATCHDPEAGYSGPDSAINESQGIYPGAINGRAGNRKPPTAAYAGASPLLQFDAVKGIWVGGMFYDGRATGWVLGDPLAEQAQGPFLNPLEQAMPQARIVCLEIAHSEYAGLFETVFGKGSIKESYINQNIDLTYARVAEAIAAFEESDEVSSFSSKFDAFWNAAKAAGKDVTKITFNSGGVGTGATATSLVQGGKIMSVTVTNGGSGYLLPPTIVFGNRGGGMGGSGGPPGSGATAVAVVENGVVVAINVTNNGSGYMGGYGSSGVHINAVSPFTWQNYQGLGLTDQELQGLAAFNDPTRGDCSRCHTLGSSMDVLPVFTDFGYYNIGVPANPANPFYSADKKYNPDGAAWLDYGLGAFLKSINDPTWESQLGKFKVPTLRNVDLRPSADFVKAYMHNGYFKTLPDVILFYTWRAHMEAMMGGGMGGGGMGGGGMGGGGMVPDPNLFPQPEVSLNLETLNFTMPGNMGGGGMGGGMMTVMADQANILAFLQALSDGYPGS